MSDLICIYWAPESITVAIPARGGAASGFSVARPESVSADDAVALGNWLKAELARHKVAGKRAAVVLPLAAVQMRRLTLPNVPENDLPDLVRLQASMKSNVPLERLRLDFVPLPTANTSEAAGRDVLLATLAGAVAARISAAIAAAGLELVSIGLAPFATAAVAGRAEGEGLLIAAVGRGVEVTRVRDGSVLFAYATELHGDDAAEDCRWLIGEITRAVVAADAHATHQLDWIRLLGPPALLTPLVEPLAARYSAAVEVVSNPAELGLPEAEAAETSIDLAPLVAAVGQGREATLPRLDFLNPRKRIEPPDRTRLKWMAAAVAGLVVLLLPFGWSWAEQGTLEGRLEELREQSAELGRLVKQGQPTLAQTSAVVGWQTESAEWATQMAEITAALPGTDRVILTELNFDPGTQDSLGKVRGTGFAKTRGDAQAVQQALSDRGYRVTPKPYVEAGRDPQYPWRFDLELLIPRTAAKPS